MKSFVTLELLGTGAAVRVVVNADHVVSALEFDSGRGGIGTTLKMISGDAVNVRGSLQDTMAKLTAGS
jgi:hypothetical protein